MTEITINGVVIQFPFKPYRVQEDYMTKVIECLQNHKNGVLESPTGTGKTLSLLCSSLAWLMIKKAQIQIATASDQLSNNNQFLKSFSKTINKGAGTPLTQSQGFTKTQIIYVSRTHSQLTQVMQELKRTSYKHVNAIILGSRDQLCINPRVAKEENNSNKIHMCQVEIKNKACSFYKNWENDTPSFDQNILDIEDLVKNGKQRRSCPYFLSKQLKDSADIIFMPYNYLLDPKLRKNQGITLKGNIILLDEAHNIEKICEEAASFQFSSTDIAVCIHEITDIMKKISEKLKEEADSHDGSLNTILENLCTFKAIFLDLERAVDSIEIKKSDEGEVFPGDYIFDLFNKSDITGKNSVSVINSLKIIITDVMAACTLSNTKGKVLDKFCDLLQTVISNSFNTEFRGNIRKYYKVYIQIEQPKKTFNNNAWETKVITKSVGKLINLWCFSPGFRMKEILENNVQSIILTSGTLSPLKSFISEIGIDIAVQLENPHIVTKSQVCVGIVSSGCDGYSLNSSYNTRNDPKYVASLGESIKSFSSILPDGLLIFFPSYPILKFCQEQWQNSGTWSQIETFKTIYVEPQSKNALNNVMNEYYKKIQDPMNNGAILMAVCRGKVSEGLDFANANGRAVLITGLPFPPLKDPRVILKQKYLDENILQGKESLTGKQWYQLEASRAVNQAIGRIIRHKNDYGAILLCDCRFDNQTFKQQLSSWIRPHIKKVQDFLMIIKELREFFRKMNAKFPQPRTISTRQGRLPLSPVQAQFDYGNNHSSKLSFEMFKSLLRSEEESFDIDAYKINNSSSSKEKSTEFFSNANDFTSLLEVKPKIIVNLSTCKLQTISQVFPKSSTSAKPTSKRKKFKLTPIEFNITEPIIDEPISSTSTSSTTTSTSTSTTTTSTSTSTSSSIPTSIISQPESNKFDKSLALPPIIGKNYLQMVKTSLSKDNYNIFKNMIAKYKNTEISFDELLTTLKKLFIDDHKQKHLFIGFRTFLKKNHVMPFDNYVKLMENSSI